MDNFELEDSSVSAASRTSRKRRTLWCIAAAVFLIICGFLAFFSSLEDGRTYPVRINEILASNTRYPNSRGHCCDYIELYNTADYPVDLTGFQLGPIDGSGRYAFPYGTTLEAKGYLVVYCDPLAEDSSYAPFGISRSGGEAVCLIASNGAVVDSATTLAVDSDQAMALSEDGSWYISAQVTPGYANSGSGQNTQDIYNPAVSTVRITEISTANTGFDKLTGQMLDWVELCNTGSEAVDLSGFSLSDNAGNDKFLFPAGTTLASQAYLTVLCSSNASSDAAAPFSLSQLGGETVVLKNSTGSIIEVVETLPMTTGQSMALTENGTWSVTSEATPAYSNTPGGYADCLAALGAAPGTVVISELMSASQAILPDAFGGFSDWAEFYNAGSQTVDLSGWYLSDDPANPQKWQFPALEIQPGEYLVIFLSGKDTVCDGQVHTGFSLSAGGESLVLSSSLGNVVDSVTFGPSEDGNSFICEAGSEPAVTCYPTPGYPNDSEGYEAFCAASLPQGPLAIWEVMTYNERYLVQPTGECYDWVELKNISPQSVNLSDYCITDDTGTPGQFVLPDKTLAPGESIAIILSGDTSLTNGSYTHAGFSLDATVDTLYLYTTGGTLLDAVFLRDIPVGCSYGRSDGIGGFFYMNPTPEASNEEGFRTVSSEPTSEIAPGVYVSATGFTVPLAAEGTVYYTLDGSDPDTSSAVYTGPIEIHETTVLRAASVEEGALISDIYTATFIIGASHDIPVVSLVTDPDNLWGPDGIYKYNIEVKEEVRTANLAYSGEDGSFSLDCRINLHGATTVTAFAKKTFAVRFLDAYDGMLNYDVFEDGEVTQFRSLIIRTAHESVVSTQIRDALMGSLAAQSSDVILSQKYKYVALYLNGEYWGLYAIRERHSPEHYATYMNVPADTVHSVRFCTDEENSLYELYRFLEYNSLKSDENYAYASSILDMESFADWIIFESYTCNLDVYGNIRYYYSTEDNIWRLGLADLDLGMFLVTGFDEIAGTFHHGRLVSAVLGNEQFQDLIATRLAQLLETTLSDENVLANLAYMENTIRNEIVLDAARWGYSVNSWERFIAELEDYIDGRAEYLIHNFCSQVNFTYDEKQAYFGHLLN